MKKFLRGLIVLSITLIGTACKADQDTISLFPLDNYDQTVTTWFNPTDPAYDKPLLSMEAQQQRLNTFYDRVFGAASPWAQTLVNHVLHPIDNNDLSLTEKGIILDYSNHNKPANELGYGENFRPYSQEWSQKIATNINLSALKDLAYHAENRAIAITNLAARALPTAEPHFHSYKLAGQGYPFDNLQMSALWAGTPVYILGETIDHAWLLVLTPDCIAWVNSTGIARVSNTFVQNWQMAAKKQLAAITQTETSLSDERGHFRLLAYVGSVFPAEGASAGLKLMIPVADNDGNATISYATVASDHATTMPLSATPHHFADLLHTLIGRPYGWGNVYFYNDCSAETKSLMTPFGIWLPRHSSDQAYAGRMVDMSGASPDQRVNYLLENGRRFMTLIYIGGHVILYVGSYPNPNSVSHEPMAMTYQSMWGLSPHPSTRRAVIGKTVLFPMLLQYPEDRTLGSLAAKQEFQVTYLDEIPNYLMKYQVNDLKSLMYPS